MTGFVFLDKPEGITSFTAARRVRGILKAGKTGHTGTLDPMATGVLPVMIGGATRFSDYLPTHDKRYTAVIRLGVTTDTLDVTGRVLSQREAEVSPESFAREAESFIGVISQIPPMFSAVSRDGVRLYKLARQGIEVEREPREVTIYSLEVLDSFPERNEYVIDVSCSAGTYIRSLAADIGEKLGCGGILTSLRRTSANGVDISRTVTLEELEQAAANSEAEMLIHPVDGMFGDYPSVTVSQKQAVRFSNGGALDLDRVRQIGDQGLYRVYSPEERFLGLGSADENTLRVAKLLIDT
ncbi:MAG: tRNA pseudouridine(55) synthase TruB [Clostridia bacterium]|nr:tRNA pseudouridine(55) synthase TruB [Clostridia bacterium]